jgi:tetratricopeptide (TPR) repeat protein
MQILHLDLKIIGGDLVELRYFQDNPNDFDQHRFSLEKIEKLIEKAEGYYYTLPEDLAEIGKQLYYFLDGDDRYLEKNLKDLGHREIILAITTAEKLAHLPWEVLHDHNGFLVEKSIVPVRWLSSDSRKNKLSIAPIDKEKKNRALQVLFMASSPTDREPVLDYEAEEARILEATKVREPEKSLSLIVEESGSLSGLREVVNPSEYGTFDILHLTGHATIKNGKPFFITEKETGEACDTSASEIADALEYRIPELVFLSGCHTGQASSLGAVPSMAEEFLQNSTVKAILGWGNTVLDTDATQAAKVLYEELSQAKQVAEAVAKTYKALIKKKARDWHLLRLYTGNTLPGELVTSWNNSEREPAPLQSVATRLFNPKGNREVPTPETFVGRRRHLQKCYKNLIDKEGVLIHGMGGLGKTSLAMRLCDRYPERERVVWDGEINEQSFVDQLADKLKSQELREKLKNANTGGKLKYRLKDLFRELQKNYEKNFLLVLDDFEKNLELRNDKYVLTLEAEPVLNAIVWAIKENFYSHRIIITCRYDFDFTNSQYLYKQPLDALRGADLQKKWKRLTASDKELQNDETLRSQVEKLADGNHRLLEELYKELRELQKQNIDKSSIPDSLKAKLPRLLEQVLTKELHQIYSYQPMEEMLQRGLVFELPVPRQALEAVCNKTVNELDKCIDKAVALGALEASYDPDFLRVPRYLGLEKLDEISLNKKAAKVLYDLWYEQAEAKTKISEERLLEIYRLAQLGCEIEIQVKMTDILATRWQNRSLFPKVIELCTKTLEDLKKAYSDVPNNQVARIKNVLAKSDLWLGHYEKAKSQYEEALNIGEQLSAEEKKKSLDYAQALDGLGYLYTLIGEYDKSRDMLEKALNIINKKTQEKYFNKVQYWHREEKLLTKVQCLSHLAYWHRVQKKWQEARFLYIKALWMCKRLPREENITLAESYHNLATFYHEYESYQKAENYYCKALALEMSPALQGQEPLSIAIISSSLAKVYCLQKLYEKAQQQFFKALNIRKRLLVSHLEIVQDMKHLGYINYELKKYIEAKNWLCQALEMIKDLIKKEDPSIDNNHDKLVRDLEDILEDVNNELGNSNKTKAIAVLDDS